MPRQQPPARFTGAPETMVLPAGAVLSRVHEEKFAATDFKPVPADVVWGGGRFDATQLCRYPYMYVTLRDDVAAAETLLRDIPFNDHGARVLPRAAWRGRRVSRLRTTADVALVALRTAEELGATGQDTWLTMCDPPDYPYSRTWAHWLRDVVTDAAGLAWFSKRHPPELVMILFGDRCPAGLLVEEPGPIPPGTTFDDAAGFGWLRTTLARYRVSVISPRA